MTIAEMVAAGDVAGLQALAHEPDKETRKAARKGLHVLRTRGIHAPVPRDPMDPPMTPMAMRGAERRAVANLLNPHGNDIVFDAVMSGRMDARAGVEQLAAAGKLPPEVVVVADDDAPGAMLFEPALALRGLLRRRRVPKDEK